jgi:hypothetical protein
MVCDDFLSLDDLSPWGLAERLRENMFVKGVLTRLLMVYMFTRSALAAMIRMAGAHCRLLHRLMTHVAQTWPRLTLLGKS